MTKYEKVEVFVSKNWRRRKMLSEILFAVFEGFTVMDLGKVNLFKCRNIVGTIELKGTTFNA